MDINAYIESGIIESYVLGLATAEEIAEVELLCSQQDEIKKAIDNFSALVGNVFLGIAMPSISVFFLHVHLVLLFLLKQVFR